MVRVFGRGGKLFSPRDERNIFLLASDLGIGPKCLVEFGNARVEQFLPGEVLTADTMRLPDTSAAVARALAAFHLRMLGPPPPDSASAAAGAAFSGAAPLRAAVWARITKWAATAKELAGEELEAAGLGGVEAEVSG